MWAAIVVLTKDVDHLVNPLLQIDLIDSFTRVQCLLNPLLSCIYNTTFIPLRADARFPGSRTEVAELSSASTGDVVATLVQLDNGLAFGTCLPMLVNGELTNGSSCCTFGAGVSRVRLLTTFGTNECPAA